MMNKTTEKERSGAPRAQIKHVSTAAMAAGAVGKLCLMQWVVYRGRTAARLISARQSRVDCCVAVRKRQRAMVQNLSPGFL